MENPSSETTRVGVFQVPGPERDALVQVLELDGFDVVSVATQEQLDLLLTSPPDVLIVDLSTRTGVVPGLFERYRSVEPHVPFLALGTMYEDREKYRYVDVGVDRFFVKPIDPPLFLMRLRSAATRHRNGKIVLNSEEATKVLSIAASPGNGKP